MRFIVSDQIAARARAAYDGHARRIHERLPGAEVGHVGGSSLPGLLTTGDVDLHVRVTADEFAAARDALALTAIGTLDDLRHGESWQRIAADPALIERYNALKRAHEGGTLEDYQAAKRAFFAAGFGR